MNNNFMKIFQLKNLWDHFIKNHPKLPLFGKAVVGQAIHEGTIIEISVTTAEGQNLVTNLKISAEDMELLNEALKLAQEQS